MVVYNYFYVRPGILDFLSDRARIRKDRKNSCQKKEERKEERMISLTVIFKVFILFFLTIFGFYIIIGQQNYLWGTGVIIFSIAYSITEWKTKKERKEFIRLFLLTTLVFAAPPIFMLFSILVINFFRRYFDLYAWIEEGLVVIIGFVSLLFFTLGLKWIMGGRRNLKEDFMDIVRFLIQGRK